MSQENTQKARFLQKVDSVVNWNGNGKTTILADKEIAYERETGKFKIGDGKTEWQYLDYANSVDEDQLVGQKAAVENGEIFNIYSGEDANQATGKASHAEGSQTLAKGERSHAEGRKTKALGKHSHAQNYSTQALGEASHAEGTTTFAYNYASHAEGEGSKAGWSTAPNDMMNPAHAEGSMTEATGYAAHAEGKNTKAFGYYSHAEGANNTTSSENSHVEGASNVINSTAKQAHAEGTTNNISGANSHVEGQYNNVNATGAHAEGSSTYIDEAANYSHVEGIGAKAYKVASHAEGVATVAGDVANASITDIPYPEEESKDDGSNSPSTGGGSSGSGSSSEDVWGAHAEGLNTRALGKASHTEGDMTKASGYCSHAEGAGTITDVYGGHVQGRFNSTAGYYAHVVGNGKSNTERSNAHTVDWNGNAWFAGDVRVGNAIYGGRKLQQAPEKVNINISTSAWQQDTSSGLWYYEPSTTNYSHEKCDISFQLNTSVLTRLKAQQEIMGKAMLVGDTGNTNRIYCLGEKPTEALYLTLMVYYK